MRALGVSGGWMFFEHAGSAVAVDLATHDVTDVFDFATLDQSTASWTAPSQTEAERRAALIARSVLAHRVDTLQAFSIPDAVRANARQARYWTQIYGHQVELPLLSSGGLVPPASVQRAAHRVAKSGLDRSDTVRAEHLASGLPIDSQLVQQMNVFFSRHPKAKVDPEIWLSWGGDAGRVWASRVTKTAESESGTLTEILADADEIDYDTLRLLPRAFSMINGPHTAECDGNGDCSCGGSRSSARYPSTRALTYLALGGDAGRAWAARTLEWAETEALTAAGYDPDAHVDMPAEETDDQDGQDGTVPHVFFPVIEFPAVCTYCGQSERDELHDPAAVSYYNADIDPTTAHYFTEQPDNAERCEVCSKAVDDTLHKQAALAGYYLHKDQYDKQIAETQQYWTAKGEPENAVTSAAELFGVDWVEVPPDDLFERAAAVDAKLDTLFWVRRGSEDSDPLTYYAAYTGDEPMLVDQVYVSDGGVFYQFDAEHMVWKQSALGNPEQVYELDDDTAREAIRALAVYPGRAVELREVDPGESLMMEGAAGLLDDGMADRTVVVSDAYTSFADYTPEERSQNARRQVRDAGGRFARSGNRIAVGPSARAGVVSKIDPATQKVQVKFDDDDSSEWVDAKSTRVMPDGGGGSRGSDIINMHKIQALPRATGHTPKGMLKALLPPMDAKAIHAVTENYPNFIAKERAGRAARRKAQQALNEQSRKRYEREQARAEADYKRRLEKIHAQGKGLRDQVEKIYRRILPPPYRRQAIGHASIDSEFAKRKKNDDTAPAAEPTDVPAAAQAITDPAQSDVAPLYLAEVDDANQQNVLDLLAMVPASTQGTDPQVLRYTATGWVPDPKRLRQIQSSAPPTLVPLDQAEFNDTMAQVKSFYATPEGKAEAEAEAKEAQDTLAASLYGEYGELLAAGIPGIADTPSDIAAAEKLKRYWTIGLGGAKVRWNTPGDWTRCNRLLKKYMPLPGQSEGYCANLHHAMTGTWPGDRGNVGRRRGLVASSLFEARLLTSDEVIAHSALIAGAYAVCAGVDAPADVTDVPTEMSGASFVIPVLAPIGVKSGDGRSFAPLSLTTRDLPLPLMWQIQTAEGHDASVIVGRIDSIERGEDGSLVNARGVFDVGPYGQEAERLVRHKFLRGVSVDLDNFEAEARSKEHTLVEREKKPDSNEDDIVRIHADDMVVTNGRVMGATLVAKPAFQEVRIQIDEGQEEEAMVADGTYIGTPNTEAETEEMIRSALTAAGIPVHPPMEWFSDPELRQETPLTVLDDGRVYGHIATWNSDHIGLPFSTRPPKSRSNYAYFHTGLLRTEDGSDVPVGQVTLAGGHAGLELNAAAAAKHYDDTASAFCDVHAGEDAYGIWVSGALRPNVTAEQVRAVRAAAPSGDWRPINGRLELVAVCQVNVPGFPVTRARVASGKVYALVAAGTATLSRLRADADAEPLDKLIERVDALEAPQRAALDAAREAALARINPVRKERHDQLTVAREQARDRFDKMRFPEAHAVKERIAAMLADDGPQFFREVGTEKRKNLAKKGHAMPNGGYPIETVGDLKNAIRAYGRAAAGEKAAVRRHIKKRARALGKTDLIPESWASMSTPIQDVAGEIEDLAARMTLISSGQYAELADTEEVTTLEELFGRGPGWITNPEGTRRLHTYWTKGKGAAKIRWGQPGDFNRCRREVGEEIGESDPGKLRFINAICAQWHKDATGARPGQAPAERAASHIDSPDEIEALATAEQDLEALAAAGGRYPNGEPWDPTNHPRDEKGRFRLVIAELKKDLEGEAGTAEAVEGLDDIQNAANQGDVEAAQVAAKGVLDLVDKIAENTDDQGAVKTLREGYTSLAEAVANLPLVFGDLNQKYRFSDLPTDLQGLITDLFKRAEARLSPEDMEKAGGKIQQFTSGIELLSQPEISAELSRILRFLI